MYKGLPKVINVGQIAVKVTMHDEVLEGARWGDFDLQKFAIRLQSSIPAGKDVEIVLHELLHAVFNIAHINDDKEEEHITVLATWLAMLFKHNPGLVKWIASATK